MANPLAELPIPPNWKPSPKWEILSWVQNQDTQLHAILEKIVEASPDTKLAADVHVAIQINQKIGQLAAALP
jgi:hypothetical protein